MGNNGNFTFLDVLTILSVILQISQMKEDVKQITTDALMDELQRQDSEYLETIISNQKLILEKLATLAD